IVSRRCTRGGRCRPAGDRPMDQSGPGRPDPPLIRSMRMSGPAELDKRTGVARRFGAFVAERHPFAIEAALAAYESATGGHEPQSEADFEALRQTFKRELAR